jgi:hypothetical protein
VCVPNVGGEKNFTAGRRRNRMERRACLARETPSFQ